MMSMPPLSEIEHQVATSRRLSMNRHNDQIVARQNRKVYTLTFLKAMGLVAGFIALPILLYVAH